MKVRTPKAFEEITVKATASAIGASLGIAMGGPLGSIVGATLGSVMSDISKRMLSPKEVERVDRIVRLAKKRIKMHIANKDGLRKDLNQEKLKEMFEGTLLAARESYEERKIPLLANLISKTPFTNTPIENLIQTLKLAEQLTYRQLCIIVLVAPSMFGLSLNLSDKRFRDNYSNKGDEYIQGVYEDVHILITQGILDQVTPESRLIERGLSIGYIKPNSLILLYPGRLLYNGLELDKIDKKDLDTIRQALK